MSHRQILRKKDFWISHWTMLLIMDAKQHIKTKLSDRNSKTICYWYNSASSFYFFEKNDYSKKIINYLLKKYVFSFIIYKLFCLLLYKHFTEKFSMEKNVKNRKKRTSRTRDWIEYKNSIFILLSTCLGTFPQRFTNENFGLIWFKWYGATCLIY